MVEAEQKGVAETVEAGRILDTECLRVGILDRKSLRDFGGQAREIDLRGSRQKIVAQLEGKTVKVDPAGFDAFVGEYQITSTLIMTISREGDKLFQSGLGPSNESGFD